EAVVKHFNDERRNNTRNINQDDVVKALADLFRVAAAESLVLGEEPPATRFSAPTPTPTFRQPVLAVPPRALWNPDLEQRTTEDVALLKIPVPTPTSAEPSEKDLKEMKALYELYKNNEPNPNRPEPGFKIPRRVKGEWVSGRADTPFFRKQAEQALPL